MGRRGTLVCVPKLELSVNLPFFFMLFSGEEVEAGLWPLLVAPLLAVDESGLPMT